jgi:hypothetical protein
MAVILSVGTAVVGDVLDDCAMTDCVSRQAVRTATQVKDFPKRQVR